MEMAQLAKLHAKAARFYKRRYYLLMLPSIILSIAIAAVVGLLPDSGVGYWYKSPTLFPPLSISSRTPPSSLMNTLPRIRLVTPALAGLVSEATEQSTVQARRPRTASTAATPRAVSSPRTPFS